MGCLLVVFAMFAPRGVLVLLWLVSDVLARAFGTWVLPLLGFFFMPYTTLAYTGAMVYRGSVSGFWLVALIVAVPVDLGVWGGGRHSTRRRRRARG